VIWFIASQTEKSDTATPKSTKLSRDLNRIAEDLHFFLLDKPISKTRHLEETVNHYLKYIATFNFLIVRNPEKMYDETLNFSLNPSIAHRYFYVESKSNKKRERRDYFRSTVFFAY
jgi:hypothetical protein